MSIESIFPDIPDCVHAIEHIPTDGHCFYTCLARSLSHVGIDVDHQKLRTQAHEILSKPENGEYIDTMLASTQSTRRTPHTYLANILKDDYADPLVISRLLEEYKDRLSVLIVEDPSVEETELPRKPSGDDKVNPKRRKLNDDKKSSREGDKTIWIKQSFSDRAPVMAVFVRRGAHYQLVLFGGKLTGTFTRVIAKADTIGQALLSSWSDFFMPTSRRHTTDRAS